MNRGTAQRLYRGLGAALLWGVVVVSAPALAAEKQADDNQARVADAETELPVAAVEIDGRVLHRVRGLAALTAEKRAANIAARIAAIAADASVPPDAVQQVEIESGTAIVAGSRRLMVVVESDARLESIDRKVLANSIVSSIREAVVNYRQARTREALINSALFAIAATGLLAGCAVLVIWLSGRGRADLERRYRRRIQSVGIQSFQIVRAEQIWGALSRLVDASRVIIILVLTFIYLQYVLGLFPWTRGTARHLLGYVLDPLGTMGAGIVDGIPNFLFLVILFFLTRYLLKLIHLFFTAVGRGEVKLAGFEREWADPTYKLLRIGVIVFALVVAYPYIPGSGSDAFKGISIFIGIVFSLGSSSAISNLIAGYSMTYRRAFRIGDRVKIGDKMGDVTEMRLQATHLRTIKNEEVIVPNSNILNNEVVNYSSLAHSGGLILHTTVGIGYETPWRQVEAMLLMAAERTPGLMKEPPPFVRHEELGDFAVSYEINVYCDNAQAMGQIYTDLHRNILDIFNEYEVQIMTPAYEGDPEKPKVVPKGEWFSAPAKDGKTESK
jgi:small-conductance mechanosensitive channel